MKRYFPFFLSLLLTALLSCSQKAPTVKHNPAPVKYDGGKLYTLSCSGNPENTYVVYLTKRYDSLELRSVIYFFDPQGKGNFPVEKYRALADEMGLIFIGSNSTKNGMDWNTTSKIAGQLISDTKEKFNINHNIYACGFSGGGRIASAIALADTTVTGIISCSAGLPVAASQLRKSLSFIGIAGLEDMNLTEIYDAGEELKNSNTRYNIIYFKGPHEWPPVEKMREAIITSHPAHFTTEKIVIDPHIIEREKQQKQFYSEAFVKNEISWWKNEFQKLENKIASSQSDEKYMYIRLKNFLSLAAFSYSNSTLNSRRLAEANKFLGIYKLVDPKNAEHAYLRTKYFMLMNNYAEAEKSLKEAAELGFTDTERIKSEQLFITLQNSESYKKITGQ